MSISELLRETERVELFGGPFDGATVTVVRGCLALPLAAVAHGRMLQDDTARAIYIRDGHGRMAYAPLTAGRRR